MGGQETFLRFYLQSPGRASPPVCCRSKFRDSCLSRLRPSSAALRKIRWTTQRSAKKRPHCGLHSSSELRFRRHLWNHWRRLVHWPAEVRWRHHRRSCSDWSHWRLHWRHWRLHRRHRRRSHVWRHHLLIFVLRLHVVLGSRGSSRRASSASCASVCCPWCLRSSAVIRRIGVTSVSAWVWRRTEASSSHVAECHAKP